MSTPEEAHKTSAVSLPEREPDSEREADFSQLGDSPVLRAQDDWVNAQVDEQMDEQARGSSVVAPVAARKLREDAQEFENVAAVIPRPFTSYAVVGNLAQTQESIADSLHDLAQWHDNAQDGTEFEDVDGEGTTGARKAAERLREAAELADQLKTTLEDALDENAGVRWLDGPEGTEHAERAKHHGESSWTAIPAPAQTPTQVSPQNKTHGVTPGQDPQQQ